MRQQLKQIKRLFKNEQAQDLIEYTLILAFVALASAALFMDAGSSVTNIWTKANTTLSPCYCHD